MKGFVPTPPSLVDRMVDKLFAGHPPLPGSLLLDPGCGTGAFIEGVLRWGKRTGMCVPSILGIDSDRELLAEAGRRVGGVQGVSLESTDFLQACHNRFDYIIGNPPYVSITGLTAAEREAYRRQYLTAIGRFDLYVLFFEQALRLLKPDGRLVFVTPEKFLYVESAKRLRTTLANAGVSEIELIDEATFVDLVTYPAITTIDAADAGEGTRVILRTGASRTIKLGASGASWLPLLNGRASIEQPHVLADAFVRISCGVATGADAVYVVKDSDLPAQLRPYAYPTLSGRGLGSGASAATTHRMLIPYSRKGDLISESELGPLGEYLRHPVRYSRLLSRTCVARKPWYAFHENPPLEDILRPKLLCKDIAPRPRFVADAPGTIVPRHSLYYLVPSDPSQLQDLCAYLNSDEVAAFLDANCQRAANGFMRLQSHVLKTIPLPERFVRSPQLVCA